MKVLFAVRYIIPVFFLIFSCTLNSQRIITGAEQLEVLNELTKGKKIGLTGNHTSMVGSVHLVDTLLSMGLDVVKIFSPEHGFRGKEGAGEPIKSSVDPRSGIPVISLYGAGKKPLPKDMKGIDVMIFDIQDVGVRFYTYISSLHYIMESCAENGVPLIVLDRPNPNGNYTDGPILEKEFSSFVGMHPVPLVHGMTIGEYARMINGEGWLKDGKKCELKVVPCLEYSHSMEYILPIPPSPNLLTQHAIRLYPSIALFEGTILSEGRGTKFPFEVYGHPNLTYGEFYFTPISMPAAKNPKLMGINCRGEDLRNWAPPDRKWEKIELQWLIKAYNNFPDQEDFFNDFFFKLCGTRQIYEDIRAGFSEPQIRAKWEDGLRAFKIVQKKYSLYE